MEFKLQFLTGDEMQCSGTRTKRSFYSDVRSIFYSVDWRLRGIPNVCVDCDSVLSLTGEWHLLSDVSAVDKAEAVVLQKHQTIGKPISMTKEPDLQYANHVNAVLPLIGS